VATTEPGLRNEPTGDLIRRLIEDVQELVDKQVALVKQELREHAGQVFGAAKTLIIGVALLLAAALMFLHFLFLGIDTLTDWLLGWRLGWLFALVFTLILGGLGVRFALKGKDEVQIHPLAETRRSLKEDAEWARHRLTPAERSTHSENGSPQPSRSSNGADAA
jgi:uncharacterized membrane protein YqjE